MQTVARLRPLMWPALLAGALLLMSAPAALAQAPKLTDHVTDQTGSLGSGTAAVEDALTNLLDSDNVELWVVFVSTTGGETAPDLAQETYQSNGLGGNDMVLLVAVSDQSYGWWENTRAGSSDIGAATGLPGETIDSLCSDNLDAAFRQGDYSGGVVDFADALGQAVAAGSKATAAAPAAGGTPSSGGATPSGNTTSSGNDLGTLLAFFGILAVIFVVIVFAAGFRAWRLDEAQRRGAGPADRRPGAPGQQAARRHRRRHHRGEAGARLRPGRVLRRRLRAFRRGAGQRRGRAQAGVHAAPAARRLDARGSAHQRADVQRRSSPTARPPGP